jgi:drug/metabolite transporter (DMT)-like permease
MDHSASDTVDSARISARNIKGVLWMIAAMITITAMFAILKHVIATMPIMVAALFRTSISFVILLPWLMRGGRDLIATQRIGGHFLRSFFGISAFVCVTFAVAHLYLADATLLSFTSPLWTILIMALLGRERIRPRRFVATIVGFVGVLVIVRPQSGFEPAALVAIFGALLASFAMIQMKDLTRTEPPTRIVFYFFFFGSLLLLPGAIWQWRTPTLSEFGWLVGAGAVGAFGQICLARAYEAAEVGVVAPLDFIRLPVAALIGFLIFSEFPDAWTWIGTAVILAAVYDITNRERKRGRMVAPTPID